MKEKKENGKNNLPDIERPEIKAYSTARAAVKKVRYASFSVVSIAVALAAVVLLNVLLFVAAEKTDLKLDLSENKVFTLSQQTLAFLEEFSSLGQEAEIIILGSEADFRSRANAANAVSAYTYIVETADNYAKACSQIKVSYVDPRYNPAYFRQRGITLSSAEDSSTIMVLYSPVTRRYRLVDSTVFSDMEYVGLERRMTGGLVYATRENIQTIGILSGHGEMTLNHFQLLMEDNGYQVKYLTLADFSAVPEEYQLLVIARPVRQYSSGDIEKIDSFLYHNGAYGKHLMVFGDLDMYENPLLETYLSDEWGLSFGKNAVFDNEKNVYTLPNVYYPFLKLNYAESTIAGNLSSGGYSQYVQLGKTRPVVRVFETRDEYATFPLVVSSDSSFSRFIANTSVSVSDFSDIRKSDTDTGGPFEIMAASQRVRYEGLTQFSSTVIAAGSSSFVEDYFVSNVDGFTESSAEYILRTVKYLVAASETIDADIVPAKLIGDSLNFENNYQVVGVVAGILIVIPAIFILWGCLVYRRRKRL